MSFNLINSSDSIKKFYIYSRCIYDLLPFIINILCLSIYISLCTNNECYFYNDFNEISIYFFEVLFFMISLHIQVTYELPYLNNKFGFTRNAISYNLFGYSLQNIINSRNKYIIILGSYRIFFSISLLCDLIIIDPVFDYFFLYIMIIAYWLILTVYLNITKYF